MYDFKNKVVVITGGAHGIGQCIANDFKAEGAKVVIIDKSPIATSCDYAYQGDIAEASILEDFARKVLERFHGVDYLINNACVGHGGLYSASYEDFLTVQKIGVAAPFMLSKLFTPYFSKQSAIINIASTRAFQSQHDTECYSAAKGGILALTHALAVSLKGQTRVNCISPGWIDTHEVALSNEDKLQHLVERVGKPKDVSNAVLFLCSEKAGFMTGENIVIDGGMSKLMIYHNDGGWTYKE
jgi:NAD(P)-dependent dehydrogenase (short-subunit alcohol dehydrogenase family)